MAKETVNYQKVYDLYQLCSETKSLREFWADYCSNIVKVKQSESGLLRWVKLRLESFTQQTK